MPLISFPLKDKWVALDAMIDTGASRTVIPKKYIHISDEFNAMTDHQIDVEDKIISSRGFDLNEIKTITSNQNLEGFYISSNGTKVPVLYSYSTINTNSEKNSRIIFVAHDLRERRKIQEKLDQERRNHSIAINEAQEKERLH